LRLEEIEQRFSTTPNPLLGKEGAIYHSPNPLLGGAIIGIHFS